MSSADIDGVNPAYDEQDGYDTTDDRYPPDWDARRKAIYQRDDYTCQDCGVKSGYHTPYGEGVILDAHHIVFLENGGSNRFDNLTTLCVDCHNDRHDHDITEGREDYTPTPTVWVRLRQLVRYCLGSVGVLLIHAVAVSLLLTQPVGEPMWLAGAGYVVLLAVAVVLRAGQSAALYALAGGVALAIMQVPFVAEFVPVSASTLVITAFIPSLLAGVWWWRQRSR